MITHGLPLDQAPQAYKTVGDNQDGCIKVVLKPHEITIHQANRFFAFCLLIAPAEAGTIRRHAASETISS